MHQASQYLSRFENAEVSPDSAGSGSAIDLVHLSRQTLGDSVLENELLSLFSRQAEHIVGRLSEPVDDRTRVELAHTLKGSARAVGAFAVADAAERYESTLREGERLDGPFARLAEVAGAARADIGRLLGRD